MLFLRLEMDSRHLVQTFQGLIFIRHSINREFSISEWLFRKEKYNFSFINRETIECTMNLRNNFYILS